MATKRLCDHDRSRLLDRLEGLLTQPQRCHLLQLTPADQQEFVESLIPEDVLAAVRKVQEFDADVVKSRATANVYLHVKDAQFEVPDCLGTIRVTIPLVTPMPSTNYVVAEDSGKPHCAEIAEWGKHVVALKRRESRAYDYVKDIVERCSSIGQVKRCLPGLEQYAPKSVAASLAEAERRSRIPAGVELNHAKYQNLMEMLALGQLCPEIDYWDRQKLALVDYWRTGWVD